MNLTLKCAIATIPLMLALAVPLAAGPLEDGYTAYTRGDFAHRHAAYASAGDQGDVTAQTVVGLMHYFNHGDYVSAKSWAFQPKSQMLFLASTISSPPQSFRASHKRYRDRSLSVAGL